MHAHVCVLLSHHCMLDARDNAQRHHIGVGAYPLLSQSRRLLTITTTPVSPSATDVCVDAAASWYLTRYLPALRRISCLITNMMITSWSTKSRCQSHADSCSPLLRIETKRLDSGHGSIAKQLSDRGNGRKLLDSMR